MEEKERLEELKNILSYHDKKYYRDSDPEISDFEYDIIKDEYGKLLQRFQGSEYQISVGYEPDRRFKKIKHNLPMLSLKNAFTLDDVKNFLERIKKFLNDSMEIEIIAEYKIDGVSFALHYLNGKLDKALTRGNGYYGEDVTKNILNIDGIPRELQNVHSELEVRGEIFFEHSDFVKLKNFSNPRNAASGSIRQLDSSVVKSRNLKYFAYSIYGNQELKTQEDVIKYLYSIGFRVNNNYVVSKDIEEIIDFHSKTYSNREKIGYDIDGIVYKVNSLALQERLGLASDAPKWAIAHKFSAETAITIVNKINICVGRTGIITPVAELSPIFIGDVKISRATLHNKDEIKRKDIREGDRVVIRRSGDVIPHVVAVDKSFRTSQNEFVFPETCPVCKTKLIQVDSEVAIRCPAEMLCRAQFIYKIKHMLSVMGVRGIGSSQINSFVNHGIINDVADIFYIENHKDSIIKFDRWGEKSVYNLINNISQIKHISIEKFIFSLGISSVGEKSSEILAGEFISFDRWYIAMRQLCKSDESEIFIKKINNLGEKIISSLINFFSNANNLKVIEKITQKIIIDDFNNQNASFLTGKTLVFTGTMTMSRAEMKLKAKKLGAKINNTVSISTDMLIVGRDPTEHKIIEAKKLNIQILNEEEWVALCERYTLI